MVIFDCAFVGFCFKEVVLRMYVFFIKERVTVPKIRFVFFLCLKQTARGVCICT